MIGAGQHRGVQPLRPADDEGDCAGRFLPACEQGSEGLAGRGRRTEVEGDGQRGGRQGAEQRGTLAPSDLGGIRPLRLG